MTPRHRGVEARIASDPTRRPEVRVQTVVGHEISRNVSNHTSPLA